MTRKILYLLCALCFWSISFAQETVEQKLETAQHFYENHEYDSALVIYNKLTELGYSGAHLYYNIGNTYYRKMDIARSILFYERAILLNPHDGDIQHNLAFAHAMQVDKVSPVGQGFFRQIYTNIYRFFMPKTWTVLSIVSFLLCLLGVSLYLFSKQILLKKLGFFAGLFFLFLSTLSYVTAYSRNYELTQREYAIIIEPTVSIKTEPSAQARVLTVLHGGLKVKILEKRTQWSQIQIEDGNIGWIETEYIERI